VTCQRQSLRKVISMRHFVFSEPAEMWKRRMDSGASKTPREGLAMAADG
jgi:hypothetical protein